MTATEVLRRLLDERGEVWGASDPYRLLVTSWSDASGHSWSFMEHRDGSFSKLTAYHLTPEQAIAATLGRSNVVRYVGLRQGEYWERTENSNYYCGGCGWKVTDHDSYCPECGGSLHKTTLGTVTCEQEEGGWSTEGDHARVWLTCGHDCMVETVADLPNFCPVCGARVVEPTTNDVDAEVTK